MPKPEIRNSIFNDLYFRIYLIAVSFGRLFVTHDVELAIVNSPHDGSLYMSRAFYLVTAHNFGPYDGRLFVKDPGISIIIAISRWFGFDYLNFLNLLHVSAAIYLAFGLIRIGVSRLNAAILVTLALFAPATLSGMWLDIIRENVDSILHLFFFAALTFTIFGWKKNRLLKLDVFILATSAALIIFVREEGVLLFSVIGVVVLIEIVGAIRFRKPLSSLLPKNNKPILSCVYVLLAVGILKIALTSLFLVKYNTTVINDFSSGSFPRFVGALRSVSGDADRPYVSITREGLRKAAAQFPYITKIAERIPDLPSPNSEHARRWGVWDEWTNSHMMFWIKDGAFGAGLTPNPSAAQAFFRSAAADIETACERKVLACVDQPSTLLPPVKLAWLGNIWPGIADGISNVIEVHGLSPWTKTSPYVVGAEGAGWSESLRLGRMYQFTGKVDFDSLAQSVMFAPAGKVGAISLEDTSVDYWCRYIDIAVNPDLGVANSLTPEAYVRFAQAAKIPNAGNSFAQIFQPQNMTAVRDFVRANGPTDCWDSEKNVPVAALLSFLKKQRGHLLGLVTSSNGAYRHFVENGASEGRNWSGPVAFESDRVKAIASKTISYEPASVKIRKFITNRASEITDYILILALISLVANVRTFVRNNVFTEPAMLFILYAGVKILALGYISITMGIVDSRLYLSLNYVTMIFAAGFVLQNWPFRQLVELDHFQFWQRVYNYCTRGRRQ